MTINYRTAKTIGLYTALTALAAGSAVLAYDGLTERVNTPGFCEQERKRPHSFHDVSANGLARQTILLACSYRKKVPAPE